MCIRDRIDIRVRLCLLEFSHQRLVADIVGEMILGTDIMNDYGLVVDLRENVLKVGQEKIKLCMTKMTAVSYTHLSTNLSVTRVTKS